MGNINYKNKKYLLQEINTAVSCISILQTSFLIEYTLKLIKNRLVRSIAKKQVIAIA